MLEGAAVGLVEDDGTAATDQAAVIYWFKLFEPLISRVYLLICCPGQLVVELEVVNTVYTYHMAKVCSAAYENI